MDKIPQVQVLVAGNEAHDNRLGRREFVQVGTGQMKWKAGRRYQSRPALRLVDRSPIFLMKGDGTDSSAQMPRLSSAMAMSRASNITRTTSSPLELDWNPL